MIIIMSAECKSHSHRLVQLAHQLSLQDQKHHKDSSGLSWPLIPRPVALLPRSPTFPEGIVSRMRCRSICGRSHSTSFNLINKRRYDLNQFDIIEASSPKRRQTAMVTTSGLKSHLCPKYLVPLVSWLQASISQTISWWETARAARITDVLIKYNLTRLRPQETPYWSLWSSSYVQPRQPIFRFAVWCLLSASLCSIKSITLLGTIQAAAVSHYPPEMEIRSSPGAPPWLCKSWSDDYCTWLIKLTRLTRLTTECPTPEQDPPKGPKLAGQLPIQMTSASKQHHDRRHLQELQRRDDRISRWDVQDKLWTCRERHVHVTGFNLQHTQAYCPAFPLPGCLNIIQATHLFQENIVQERNTRSWGPQSLLPIGPQAHSKIKQNLSTPTE